MEQKKKSKIMYSILREFSEENRTINAETYGIEFKEFASILNFLKEEGLVRNIDFAKGGGAILVAFYENAEVTMKGLEYLKENSSIAKGYKTIKEIRDWLPL